MTTQEAAIQNDRIKKFNALNNKISSIQKAIMELQATCSGNVSKVRGLDSISIYPDPHDPDSESLYLNLHGTVDSYQLRVFLEEKLIAERERLKKEIEAL